MAQETYALGPANGSLRVHTTRQGVAAKAGHDLVIEVGSWSATLTTSDPPTFEFSADSTSLQVLEGNGGMKPLSDKDRGEIKKNIDSKILKQQPIKYSGGQLELVGTSRPATVNLEIGDDGQFTGSATVVQSEWGIKPYTGLMGALKVADPVEIRIEGKLPG